LTRAWSRRPGSSARRLPPIIRTAIGRTASSAGMGIPLRRIG